MGSEGDRAVSSVVGVVLLLAITIVGTGVVVGIGAQAFADAERATTISQTEHSLTQFDSKAAIVALGESSSQRVDLGPSGDGEFVADDDAGWLRVVHHNATGSSENETIYNASLGSVSYHNEDVEIGYQGGGVWERRDNGSVMRSPPEFNYRGATLTLPSIRVTTDSQSTGRTTAIVRQANDSRRVFPNESATDGDEDWVDTGAPYGDGTAYSNPVTSGEVTVTVKSRFYEGWAEFFRTRTTGNVSVDHDRQRASVELVTVDTVGDFTLSDVISNDRLNARGQAPGHSLTDFNVTFQTEKQGSGFSNFYGGFYLESGPHRFEYVVHASGSSKDIELSMFYRDSRTGVQHEWSNTAIDPDTGPIRIEENGKRSKLIVNLTAGNTNQGLNLTYGDANTKGTHFDWEESRPSDVTFNHPEDNSATFDAGTDSATTYLLSRHYVANLGDDFTVNARGTTGKKGGGVKIDEPASQGVFDYESGSGGTYITYLHVTENEIEVEFE
jgi:flagellin-like protein